MVDKKTVKKVTNLEDCELQKNLIIDSVNLSPDQCFRLREIGLTEGANIQVCQNCGFGGKVISKGAERLGVDRNIAESINVHYAD
ncbi:MAG: ferrous iron transport protein A [Candidatus Ancillula sp.]|jgi:ferrous iron transport protein A|nr:ferrous iron transport protein A [Candidatus Ancillula sp.]